MKIIKIAILTIAALFAAGFSVQANAQVAEVWERPNFRTPIGDGGSTPFIDASGTIEEICAPTYRALVIPPSGVIRLDSNGVPGPGIDFNCTTTNEGDLIWIISRYSPREFDGPFRVYRTRNNQLAAAQQKLDFKGDPVLKAGSDLDYPNEFFMMPVFVETDNPVVALGFRSGSGGGGGESSGSGGSSGGGGSAGAIIGGVAVVGGLVWALSSGGTDGEFAFSPEWNHSITESGYSANVGGRMDFAKDNWRLYYTASQTNANGDFGDFRYSSGGKWQGDIFAATFSESVQGETADYDLSLSANWTGGIWKISPAFAIDSVYEKGEFQTTNSFRINGEMRYDDWRFSASGNKTQMELSAVYRF